MRLIIILLLALNVQAQNKVTILIGKNHEDAAQLVTNRYASMSGLTASERTAVKTAVASLVSEGIYNKIISLNIGKFFDGVCYNVIVPEGYDGAYNLTVKHGSPTASSTGLVMASTDTLNTHFINDLAKNAPYIGAFWVTAESVSTPVVFTGPFSIEPRFGGKAYVNIWGSGAGVTVPAPPTGFNYAQRKDSATVEIFQGTTKYSDTEAISGSGPVNRETLIPGGYTLKAFGFTEKLTDSEVSALKTIIDTLLSSL